MTTTHHHSDSADSHVLALGTITAFVLAGRAVFTVRNPRTGNRFTYRVTAGKGEGAPHFVAVLTGPDNTADYTYLGCIFTDGRFVVTKKSRISPKAPSSVAFRWVWERLHAGRSLGPVEVHHEGRCGRCGRPLTVPESIESGLGPICIEKMAA
jgi:hypothetical protein